MKCANCEKHSGTDVWVGDGGMMSYVHGAYAMWCKCCILKTQIDNIELQMESLKKLKKDLKETIC